MVGLDNCVEKDTIVGEVRIDLDHDLRADVRRSPSDLPVIQPALVDLDLVSVKLNSEQKENPSGDVWFEFDLELREAIAAGDLDPEPTPQQAGRNVWEEIDIVLSDIVTASDLDLGKRGKGVDFDLRVESGHDLVADQVTRKMTVNGVDFGKDNDLDLDLSPRWLVDADLAVVTLPNPANDSVGEDDKEIERDMSQGCDLVSDPKCDHDRHLGKEDSVETDKVMKDFVSEGDLDLGPEGDPSHGIVCVEQGLNCDLDPNGPWLSLMDVTPNRNG